MPAMKLGPYVVMLAQLHSGLTSSLDEVSGYLHDPTVSPPLWERDTNLLACQESKHGPSVVRLVA